jgi:hypothetical protein
MTLTIYVCTKCKRFMHTYYPDFQIRTPNRESGNHRFVCKKIEDEDIYVGKSF